MAPLGTFDATLCPSCWFDSALDAQGWFDEDLIVCGGALLVVEEEKGRWSDYKRHRAPRELRLAVTWEYDGVGALALSGAAQCTFTALPYQPPLWYTAHGMLDALVSAGGASYYSGPIGMSHRARGCITLQGAGYSSWEWGRRDYVVMSKAIAPAWSASSGSSTFKESETCARVIEFGLKTRPAAKKRRAKS